MHDEKNKSRPIDIISDGGIGSDDTKYRIQQLNRII